MLEII
jgi:hypothetical protein